MVPGSAAYDGRMAQAHKDYSADAAAHEAWHQGGRPRLPGRRAPGLRRRPRSVAHGVERLGRAGREMDVVVVFATREREIRSRFATLAGGLQPAGRLWVAWPEKAAAVPTDLDFDTVQRIGLDAGLVDNKSASITDVFQGLQFVYRLEDRTR